jgi:hypothetical protein
MIVAGEFTPRQFENFVPFQVDYKMLQGQAEMQQKYYDAFEEIKNLSPNALTGDADIKAQYQQMVKGYADEVENAYMNNDDLRLATRFMKTKARDIGTQWKPGGKAFEINENYGRYHSWRENIEKQYKEGHLTQASYTRLLKEAEGFKTFEDPNDPQRFIGGQRPNAIDPHKFITDRLAQIETDYIESGWSMEKDGTGNVLYMKEGQETRTKAKIMESIIPTLVDAMAQSGQLQDEQWYSDLVKDGRYNIDAGIQQKKEATTKMAEKYDVSKAKDVDARYNLVSEYNAGMGLPPLDKNKFKKDSKYRQSMIDEHNKSLTLFTEEAMKEVADLEAKVKEEDKNGVDNTRRSYFYNNYISDLVEPYAVGKSTIKQKHELRIGTDHYALINARAMAEFEMKRRLLSLMNEELLQRPAVVGVDVKNPYFYGLEPDDIIVDGKTGKIQIPTIDTQEKVDWEKNYDESPVVHTRTNWKTGETTVTLRGEDNSKIETMNSALNNLIAAGMISTNGLTKREDGKYDFRDLNGNAATAFQQAYKQYHRANATRSLVGINQPHNEDESKKMMEATEIALTTSSSSVFRVKDGVYLPTSAGKIALNYAKAEKGTTVKYGYEVLPFNTLGYGAGHMFTITRKGKDPEYYFVQSNSVVEQQVTELSQKAGNEYSKRVARADNGAYITVDRAGNILLSFADIDPKSKNADFRGLNLRQLNNEGDVGYINPQTGQAVNVTTIDQLKNQGTDQAFLNRLRDAHIKTLMKDFPQLILTEASMNDINAMDIQQSGGFTSQLSNLRQWRVKEKQWVFLNEPASESFRYGQSGQVAPQQADNSSDEGDQSDQRP